MLCPAQECHESKAEKIRWISEEREREREGEMPAVSFHHKKFFQSDPGSSLYAIKIFKIFLYRCLLGTLTFLIVFKNSTWSLLSCYFSLHYKVKTFCITRESYPAVRQELAIIACLQAWETIRTVWGVYKESKKVKLAVLSGCSGVVLSLLSDQSHTSQSTPVHDVRQ